MIAGTLSPTFSFFQLLSFIYSFKKKHIETVASQALYFVLGIPKSWIKQLCPQGNGWFNEDAKQLPYNGIQGCFRGGTDCTEDAEFPALRVREHCRGGEISLKRMSRGLPDGQGGTGQILWLQRAVDSFLDSSFSCSCGLDFSLPLLGKALIA